jgi:hypothetical protein
MRPQCPQFLQLGLLRPSNRCYCCLCGATAGWRERSAGSSSCRCVYLLVAHVLRGLEEFRVETRSQVRGALRVRVAKLARNRTDSEGGVVRYGVPRFWRILVAHARPCAAHVIAFVKRESSAEAKCPVPGLVRWQQGTCAVAAVALAAALLCTPSQVLPIEGGLRMEVFERMLAGSLIHAAFSSICLLSANHTNTLHTLQHFSVRILLLHSSTQKR